MTKPFTSYKKQQHDTKRDNSSLEALRLADTRNENTLEQFKKYYYAGTIAASKPGVYGWANRRDRVLNNPETTYAEFTATTLPSGKMYRTICVDDISDISFDNPGISWTGSTQKAWDWFPADSLEISDLDGTPRYVLEAKYDESIIDWPKTFFLAGYYDEEGELRVLDESKIEILNVYKIFRCNGDNKKVFCASVPPNSINLDGNGWRWFINVTPQVKADKVNEAIADWRKDKHDESRKEEEFEKLREKYKDLPKGFPIAWEEAFAEAYMLGVNTGEAYFHNETREQCQDVIDMYFAKIRNAPKNEIYRKLIVMDLFDIDFANLGHSWAYDFKSAKLWNPSDMDGCEFDDAEDESFNAKRVIIVAKPKYQDIDILKTGFLAGYYDEGEIRLFDDAKPEIVDIICRYKDETTHWRDEWASFSTDIMQKKYPVFYKRMKVIYGL